MTNLPAVMALDADVAERASDPAAAVIAMCERAKAWLTDLLADGSIEEIAETKSQAEAIRVYTRQKNLGKDAELAASEVVRRAERGIALAVRRGQEEGTITTWEDARRRGGRAVHGLSEDVTKPNSGDFFAHNRERQDAMAMADGVPDEQFDAAIDEAKDEGNLSRANVVRKVKGQAQPQDRGEYHRKRRHIDHYRVLSETVAALEGLMTGIRLLDMDAIPEVERGEWADQLRDALRPLNKFAREVSHG